MLKIAVLASSRATDLQAVIDAISRKELNSEVSVLISNKKDAYALERASKNGIESVFVSIKEFSDIEDKEQKREAYDKKVSEIIDRYDVDLVLLIGYMRIVSSWFVNRYKNKIVNIHPSLLPDFAGGMDTDVHQQVLDAGVSETGCTLHFVEEDVDSGPIIMQQKVAVSEDDTAESLKEKVQKAEGEVIVKALKLFSEGKIEVNGDKVEIKE